MPLDDQSILAPNLKNNKLHNLSKNHSIEILPNSTYPFKHGFYFQKYLNQRYFIQLDNELSEKLELEGDVEYENLNNKYGIYPKKILEYNKKISILNISYF